MPWNALHTSDRLLLSHKLHYRDLRRFLDQLQWSLEHASGSVRLYAELLKLTPGDEEAFELERLLQQEVKHYALMEELYLELKGSEPDVYPAVPRFTTYREGLQEAVRMEREAIRQYRDTYLLTPSPRIRDVFFLAMSDGVDQLATLFLLTQQR